MKRNKSNKLFKKGAWVLVILVIALIGAVSIFAKPETEVQTIETETVNDRKLEEIRSRETIKKQQELLVKETYLTEEKQRLSEEKAAAIAQYDLKISEIETGLEQVRGDKLSF